jgi:hypothetical protein
LGRNGGGLPFAAPTVVIKNDPIVRLAKPVSPGCIGKQGCILAFSAARVQYGEPGLTGGIEPPRRNAVQFPRLRQFAIFQIDIQKLRYRDMILV